jgi:hypothetical protein
MARLLWQQKQDIGPPARVETAMVYMASTGKTLLWGGRFNGDARFADTWQWDGEGWLQVADTGPLPYGSWGIAFDSLRNVAVLFNNDSNNRICETWEWDGEGWTQVEDDGPHPGLATFQMVYDTARQVTVLEGGSVTDANDPQALAVGTWVWDGTTWTQVADVGPPRRGAAMANDARRERLIRFGGGYITERDTWEWDGNAWERVEDIGPKGRFAHGMTGTSGATLLFGGLAVDPASSTSALPFEVLRDTWTWDGRYWRQRQDMGPSPRAAPGLTWDTARTRAVLFGGATFSLVGSQIEPTYFADTWESFENI